MWKPNTLPENSAFTPDTAIVVQEQIFHAHQVLLTAHSGYFNTLLADCKEKPPSTQRVININRISSHSFSVLLSFLYDGQLRVTMANINEVLFAAEYLNMPAAILTCKCFIEQNFPLLAGLASPCRNQFLYSGIFPPMIRNPIGPILNPYIRGFNPIPDALPIRPIPTVPRISTTIINEQTVVPSDSSQQQPRESSDSEDDRYVSVDSPTTVTNKSHLLFSIRQNLDQSKSIPPPENDDDQSKTILDIAACDGPVKFERVLNKNYKTSKNKENCNVEGTPAAPLNKATESDSPRCRTETPLSCSTSELSNVSFDDNSCCSVKDSWGETSDKAQNESHKLYHCVFCNHSFKSYYCYEKHKQRHINPNALDKSQFASCVEKPIKAPLEMNVAFYPCKMCGGKFPSYYFVHKHKKYCKGKPDNDKTSAHAS